MTVNRKTKHVAREISRLQGIPYLQALKQVQEDIFRKNAPFHSTGSEFAQALLLSKTGNHVLAGGAGQGKTALAANAAAYFLAQGKTVAWYSPGQNENLLTFSKDLASDDFYYAYDEIDDMNRFMSSDLIVYDEIYDGEEKYLYLFLRSDNQMIVNMHGSSPRKAQSRIKALGIPTELISTYSTIDREEGFLCMQDSALFKESNKEYFGKVISVVSPRGGNGKTTIALTLATYLAHASEKSYESGIEERALRVAVIDMDIRDGQIGFMIGALSPSIVHMQNNGISESSLKKSIIHSDKLKVDVLLAPKRPARQEIDNQPEFYSELIQLLKKKYDYIIIDTSVNHYDPIFEEAIFSLSDRIILATDITVSSLNSMATMIQRMTGNDTSKQELGIAKNKIGIVVNKSMANTNMSGKKISAATLGIPIISIVPNEAKIMTHAQNIQSMESLLDHESIFEPFEIIGKTIVGSNYSLS